MTCQIIWTIIYITFHSKAADHTFFSSTRGIFFFKIDQILGHKSSLSKFKKFEIILGIFSNHKVMRLEINKRKKKKPAKTQTSQSFKIYYKTKSFNHQRNQTRNQKCPEINEK